MFHHEIGFVANVQMHVSDVLADTFLELFGIPADAFPVVLLIKFLFLSIVGQIDWHVPNLICRTCTGDK
jgi:Na+-translocating ferredoxin:NAD+ oxidoreductase RnfD subunit